MSGSSKIYLSYSFHDACQVNMIIEQLEFEGLNVIKDEYDFMTNSTVKIMDQISQNVKFSDIFIIVLSKHSLDSKWVFCELEDFVKSRLNPREISIIPVYLSNKIAKPKFISSLKGFDLENNFNRGLQKLVDYLKIIPLVDFNTLSARSFENLVRTLLDRLDFSIIQNKDQLINYKYDFEAISKNKDPFDGYVEAKWIVEIKFYKESRADITALKRLSEIINNLSMEYNGILITNGQLTSSAQAWLSDNTKKTRTNIRVVDGIKLKELVLNYPDIVHRFFVMQENQI